MTINEIQDEIIEEFIELDDWMDRYQYLSIGVAYSLPWMRNTRRSRT